MRHVEISDPRPVLRGGPSLSGDLAWLSSHAGVWASLLWGAGFFLTLKYGLGSVTFALLTFCLPAVCALCLLNAVINLIQERTLVLEVVCFIAFAMVSGLWVQIRNGF